MGQKEEKKEKEKEEKMEKMKEDCCGRTGPRGHKKSLHSLSLDHYLNSHKVSIGAFLLKPSVEQSVFPTSWKCISHFLKVYFPVLASKFQPSCFYPPPCDSSLE